MKMKTIILTLIFVVVVGTLTPLFLKDFSSIQELKHLSYLDIFNQEESEYLVYFYQEGCGSCEYLSPDVLKTAKEGQTSTGESIPIYVIDMQDSTNYPSWYDWETHHQTYDQVIGQIIDNEEVLNEGESRDKYPQSEGWVIQRVGQELVATYNTPLHNLNPQTPEEVEIPGTPSIFQIKEGQLETFASDYESALSLLQSYLTTTQE